MDLERTIGPFIKKISQGFPVLLVCGQRQIGKSWILNHIKNKNRKYVSLDDLQIRRFAREDPKLFIETYPPPVIIDEIQYAPDLFTYIKIYVDEHQKKKGLFWLSGSQQFRMMKGIKESLAGRVAIIDMLGLAWKEITKKPHDGNPFLPSMDMVKQNTQDKPLKAKPLTAADVYKNIWNGSFPELLTSKRINRDTFYKSYIRTYIERDVMDDIGIINEMKYYDFIRAAAARTGNLLNYTNLANDVEINVRTAKKWLETLVRSGIVYILEPYSANINRRIVNTPKLYFLDTGLAAYLTKWDTPQSLMNGAMGGALLETYVFSEILKSYWHNGKEESIYFYRDSNGREIDFIIEKNMTLYPIEVKKTASPGVGDFRHFSVFSGLKEKKAGTGTVICLSSEIFPIGNNVISCPVWKI
jgi:predicted AAA+ superfamily ATPase